MALRCRTRSSIFLQKILEGTSASVIEAGVLSN